MPGYPTYALTLPSAQTVVVRRADAPVLVGRDHMLLPLLSLASAVAGQTEDDRAVADPPKPYDTIRRLCETCLVSPRMPEDIAFEAMPFSDALAIYHWAMLGTGTTQAYGTREFQSQDFAPMIRGTGALYLDMLCARYGLRPSVCLGIEAASFSLDLDLAVAYRGICREHDGMSGEAEVPDIHGNLHKVPRQWLAQYDAPQEAKTSHIEWIAREPGMALSIGGIGGDATLGPMPRPGSNDRAQF